MTPLTAAQQLLVKKYLPVARHIAANFPALGDDAIGVANLTLCEAVAVHDPRKSPMRPWIILLVNQALINAARNRQTQHDYEQPFPLDRDGLPVEPSDENAERERVDAEEIEWVGNHLDHLRQQDRLLLEAIFFQNHTYAEVSESFGISKTATHRRVQHLLEEIRADIEAEYNESPKPPTGEPHESGLESVRERGSGSSGSVLFPPLSLSRSGPTPDRKAG